jgi:hypothetical protein
MKRKINLDAEAETVAACREVWERETDKLVRMLAECAATHTSPPDGYWVAEHEARVKYRLASLVYDVMAKG